MICLPNCGGISDKQNLINYEKNLPNLNNYLLLGIVSAQDLVVETFNRLTHEGGDWHEETFEFPEDVSEYNKVEVEIKLNCPAGGCDPWDRFAVLQLEHNGEDFEIARYITPYRITCGWTIDITPYRDMLSGNVILKSNIQTYDKGWGVTANFKFYKGQPEYEYVKVQNLWLDYNFIYGDTIFYKIDLPEFDIEIPNNVEKVVYRMAQTGHGQGNTDNAAEFSPKTHEFEINGSKAFDYYIWNDDCKSNTCSPQQGNWEPNRAGWCPGQDVPAKEWDITNEVVKGSENTFDYVLEPYFNEISPWNPDCNGPDCAYNSREHTQPIYKISAQLVYYSSSPIDVVSVKESSVLDDKISIYPNPSNGIFEFKTKFSNDTDLVVEAYDMSGKMIFNKNLKNQNLTTNTLDFSSFEKGLYLLKTKSGKEISTRKIMIL